MTVDIALEEERDFLLRSIADLDAEHAAGEIAADDYRSLRDGYTARAAEVLRLLASGSGSGPEDVAEVADDVRRRGPRRMVIAVVVLALGVGAGLAVAGASGERVRGDQATGSIPEASTDRITRAEALVSEGKVLEAVQTYDALLADDPDNPVALAERGWLVSRVDPSLVDDGLRTIEHAIEVAPDYAAAHFFRGMILFTAKGDAAGAASAFQAALDAGPPPDMVRLIEDARDRALAAAGGA